MYVFGFAKNMGWVRNAGRLSSRCYWITLRKEGEMIPSECVMAWVRNSIGQWDCLFPGLMDTPEMYAHIRKEIERLVSEMRERDFLKRMNPLVTYSRGFSYVFAYDAEQAVKTAYEAGLRSVPDEWQKLSYYEYLQNRKPGDIQGE